MKIFKAYSTGLVSASKSKIMTTVIYAVTLLLALILAIPFHNTLSIQAGNSMAPGSMLKDFDFTTYTDFLRQSGKAIAPFLTTAVWMGFFYLIFTVFFSGGVLRIVSGEEQKFSIKNFLEGCGEFFFRFLRLAVYMLITQIIIISILIFIIAAVLAASYPSVQSEASLFYIFLAGAIVCVFFLILFLTITDYAKIILFREDSKKVLKSIWTSIKFVFKNFFGSYPLYLLLLIAPVVFFLLYFWLDGSIGMVSGFTIFIMFLVQQIFIWARTWVKIWFLGSEISYFNLVEEDRKLKEEISSSDAVQNQAEDDLINPQTS